MSFIGHSTVRDLVRGGIWRSRSTVITLSVIFAFLIFAGMVLYAGYFDAGFGAAGIMFLSGIAKFALDHQRSTDSDAASPAAKPNVSIQASEEPKK